MVVIGMISGTSIDAIDVAAARFHQSGDELTLACLAHAERPWPPETRARLLAALPPASVTMAEICALDVLVAEAFAAAAIDVIPTLSEPPDLICSHGQTVFHWVEHGKARGTLQLGQPAIIAEATGLPVVSDLRARDIAAGGQGAPLASTLDALWLAGPGGPRAALNLGGIANLTIVGAPGDPVTAYDTGPASCLLDLEAARLTQGSQTCDIDGRLALQGAIRPDLLASLLADPYYARHPPKSTGRELFDRAYLQPHLAGLPPITGPDLMATLTELTARTIAGACARHRVTEIVVSGGGVRNPALMQALRRALTPAPLIEADHRGLPADAKEAYLVALLGYLTWHGHDGTVPGATGAAAPRILGQLTPGSTSLRLPAPQPPPRTLRLTTPS